MSEAYCIKRVMPQHQKIIDLCLSGMSVKEISMLMGMTPQMISLITNSPHFQHDLARRRNETNKEVTESLATAAVSAREILDKAQGRAAEVQVNLLNSEDDNVALRASNSILDRVLGASSQTNNIMVLDAEALRIMQLALQESSEVVDVAGVESK